MIPAQSILKLKGYQSKNLKERKCDDCYDSPDTTEISRGNRGSVFTL